MASATFRPTFSQQDELVLDVPLAGLVDTPHAGAVPREAATIMRNFHFDRLALERRKGRMLVGNKLDEAGHLQCHAGYQFRTRSGDVQLLRVQGQFLYRLSAGAWVGAVSGLAIANDPDDTIGNDTGLGKFVQYNDKLYWCDGGTLQRYYDGTTIRIWGFQGGSLPAGTCDGDSAGGYLTLGATYSYVWTLYNPTTGVETNPSDQSPEFTVLSDFGLPVGVNKAKLAGGSLTVGQLYDWVYTLTDPVTGDETAPSPASPTFKVAGANKKKKVKAGPWPDWVNNTEYTTINFYRSKAGVPGTWYLEASVAGITNFNTTAQNFTLEDADGALGAVLVAGSGQSQDITIGPWAGWSPDYEGYTTIRVYRTPANIQGEYYLELEIENIVDFDTTAVTATLSKSDSELEADNPALFDNDPPPAVLYGILYQEQVVAVAADDPTAIIWSKPANPNVFPSGQKRYADRDSGDPIAMIFVMVGRLYVLKRSGGLFGALPDGIGGYVLEKITQDGDCQAPFSVITYGTHAFWFGAKGAPQFDGQSLQPFSDRSIRQTYARFARAGGFGDAVGVHDPQPDKQYLRWLVQDPDDGFTYHLVYDLARGAWFTELAADGVSAGGGRDRTAWIVRDTDGRQWVYTADDEGRCFRLRTDEDGDEVWSDAGEPFTSDWFSSWIGNGVDSILPLYVDGERERCATGKKASPMTVRVYRDIDGTSTPKTQDIQPFDSGDSPHGSRPFRVRLNAKVCRRIGVRLTVAAAVNADLAVMRLALTAKAVGKRMRGA